MKQRVRSNQPKTEDCKSVASISHSREKRDDVKTSTVSATAARSRSELSLHLVVAGHCKIISDDSRDEWDLCLLRRIFCKPRTQGHRWTKLISLHPREFRRSPSAMANREGEEQVMSEVHLGCPPHVSGPYISHFTVSPPPTRHGGRLQKGASSRETLRLDNGYDYAQNGENCYSFEHNDSQSSAHIPQQDMSHEHLCLDKDGDLVLTRRENPNNRCLSFGLSIQHSITSSLLEVGLQVWKAALVLTDFILHKSFTSSYFNDVVAVELGAGTGLVGIVLSRVAKKVFITDKGVHILNNCDANTHVNSSMLKCKDNTVRVRELDWMDSWPPNVTTDSSSRSRSLNKRYLWSSEEIEEVEGATVLLAADVIYSDELTDSFFSMAEKLMARGSHKTLYLALEKRYNFSLDELDVVANGYSHFRTYFKSEDYEEGDRLRQTGFVGKQIDLADIPQYMREYDRGKDVELWKITYHRGGLGVLPQ